MKFQKVFTSIVVAITALLASGQQHASAAKDAPVIFDQSIQLNQKMVDGLTRTMEWLFAKPMTVEQKVRFAQALERTWKADKTVYLKLAELDIKSSVCEADKRESARQKGESVLLKRVQKDSPMGGLIHELARKESAPTVAASGITQNFDGRYYANVSGGQLSLVLIQKGDKVLGKLDGLGGYAYELDGEIKQDGIVGTFSNGKGRGYFSGKNAGINLQMMFAEANRQGQPNLTTARSVIFSSGAPTAQTGRQAPPQYNSQPLPSIAMQQNRGASQAGNPTVKQCRDAWSACQNQCLSGKRELINQCFSACEPHYKRCMGGRSYSDPANNSGHGSVNDIKRQQYDMHIQNVDCMDDYRKC